MASSVARLTGDDASLKCGCGLTIVADGCTLPLRSPLPFPLSPFPFHRLRSACWMGFMIQLRAVSSKAPLIHNSLSL